MKMDRQVEKLKKKKKDGEVVALELGRKVVDGAKAITESCSSKGKT